MNHRRSVSVLAGTAVSIGLLMGSAISRAEPAQLTLIHPFPDSSVYTSNCLDLVAAINDKGKGLVNIKVLSHDSMPMAEQPRAVGNGKVDLACVPASSYAEAVPENIAITTANAEPMAVRDGGGVELMDAFHRQYLNVTYLGWTSGGTRFRIYLKDAPIFNEKGLPDLGGVTMPDSPVHGLFLRAMGARTVPVDDVAGALQSGKLTGTPWQTHGLTARGLDKPLRHAIDHDYFYMDIGWLMNLDSWNRLDSKTQKLLRDMVAQFEKRNAEAFVEQSKQEKQALVDGGMQFHAVPNRVHFRRYAVNSLYEGLEHVSESQNRDTNQHARLRKAFQNP